MFKRVIAVVALVFSHGAFAETQYDAATNQSDCQPVANLVGESVQRAIDNNLSVGHASSKTLAAEVGKLLSYESSKDEDAIRRNHRAAEILKENEDYFTKVTDPSDFTACYVQLCYLSGDLQNSEEVTPVTDDSIDQWTKFDFDELISD